MDHQFGNHFFVNRNSKRKGFWDKDFRILLQNSNELTLNNENCICLMKKGKLLNKWVSRYYSIQGTYLLYGYNDLKGFKKLDNVYLKTIEHAMQFDLMHDGVSLSLFANSKHDFLQFKSELEQYCILIDFHSHFTIFKQIGFGSTAQVYIAKSSLDDQMYAIKRVHKTSKLNPDFLMEEIAIMRDLRHPNILKLFKVFETNKHINMVLELIEGGELLKHNKYHLREARVIAKQLALCVDYMHQKGVMHRDLKPQNVLCKANSLDIVLADFGLATIIKNKNHTYYRCGTTGYVAPEVLTYKDGSKMYSEKCDIFSLGVIFYQLFFHIHPFKDVEKKIILKKNMNIEFKFDDSIKVPQSCKSLISSMLRDQPKRRPSAHDVLRHEFFSEQLYEQLNSLTNFTNTEQVDYRKSIPSLSFQQGEMKFSTIYHGFKQFEDEIEPRNQKSCEFKELSPLWSNKIELHHRRQSQKSSGGLQRQKSYDVRSQKASIFRMEYKQQTMNFVFGSPQDEDSDLEIVNHQIPYISLNNMLLRRNK